MLYYTYEYITTVILDTLFYDFLVMHEIYFPFI